MLSKPLHWFATFLLATAFIVLFFPALRELFLDWELDPNYQHGLLIPIISAYLMWQKRKKLQTLTFSPSFGTGLVIFCLAMLVYVVATAGAEWFLSRMAMLMGLVGLVIYFGGTMLFRQLWFSLLYLGFMVPLPYVLYHRLAFPLQQLASFGAFQAMQLFGIPGMREGNILHFSGFSMEVIEACSGLRSMMILSALAALLAYMSNLPSGLRWILFMAAVPLAVIANVLRLIVIAALGIFWNTEAAQGILHEGSGILVFLCGLFLLVGLTGLLQWFNSLRRIG
ncbi:MAG: exosortase/archaeosortase family protein [bacterium]